MNCTRRRSKRNSAPDRDERAKQLEKEVITELNFVMDAFVQLDLESLSRHVHPRMVELDSSSPYRGVGKASFLEHMAHFFEPPRHVEGHFVRIKDPLVQIYGGDMAIVTFYYDLEGSVGGAFARSYGKASFVFVKDRTLGPDIANTWLLALSHYANLPGVR